MYAMIPESFVIKKFAKLPLVGPPLVALALLMTTLPGAAQFHDSRAERLSPLVSGYVERAKIMTEERNFAGVIDQIKHLETQSETLDPQQRQDCAYLLAMALYERGDADCVELLREFSETYPASPLAMPTLLASADYFFFAHHYSNALAAYMDIDFDRINPADRPLYDYRKALSMVKTGYLSEARESFLKLRDNRNFNTAADYYLAYIDYAQGKYEQAFTGFSNVEKKLKVEAEGIEPLYYIAQIEYARGDYGKVIADAGKLIRRGTSSELLPETLRILGLSYFKEDDYSQARKFLSRYLATPDYAPGEDAIYALGVIDYSEGRLKEARQQFSNLTDLDNDLAQSALLYLGQIAQKEGDSGEAAIYFEKASKMNFDNSVSETALYNYLAARTHGGNVPFSSAIPMLNDFLTRFPDSGYAPEVEEYLATAYYNEKDYSRALESINRISRPSREVMDAKQKILYELGMECMANNRPSAARNYLREAVIIGSDRNLAAQADLWLGDACYSIGQYREAEEAYLHYLAAERNGENRPLALYDLAYAMMMQEKYKGAVEYFSEALDCRHSLSKRLYDDALIRMADAQYYLGNYKTAVKNYTTAIDNNAADSDYATYRRAVMYGLGGDINLKLRELTAMQSRYPGSRWLPDALLEKGQTYTGLGDMANAVKAFEELRTSYGKSSQARKGMLDLAISYMKAGDESKAEETYREIIEKWPTSEEALLANDDLRRFYSENGGLREYSQFLKGVPDAPQMDADELERLAFEGAETKYADDASNTRLLEQYVADYPNGRYLADALFDIAEANYEEDNDDAALEAINRLLERRADSARVPEALTMKGEILESRGYSSRKEALDTYKKLEASGNNDFMAEAFAGIMRTTDDDRERLKYALLVKDSNGLSSDMIEEAEYYQAMALISGNEAPQGEKILIGLSQNPKSLTGAKAAVALGEYRLGKGDLDGAEQALKDFTDEGSPHEYWLARGFIALADVFHKRGKDYLAVEYLKSLHDNYPGSELDIHDMISSRLKEWE